MYPNASELDALERWRGLHCRVTNTLIEEQRRLYESGEKDYAFSAMCKAGKWYLSVTYDVAEDAVARQRGSEAAAFDWGLDKLLTIAKVDGTLETIDNPRRLKSKLDAIKALQRTVSVEEIKAQAQLGLAAEAPLKKGQRLPVTAKLKRLYAQVRSLHGKVARQRHDFYHKLTAQMVSRFAFLGTEELAAKNMSRAPKCQTRPGSAG